MQTSDELRKQAAEHERRRQESFERSDTDGFVSQFCSGLEANRLREQAAIQDAGGVSDFLGLYEGNRRVAAKLVTLRDQFSRGIVSKWLLHHDERRLIAERGSVWLPSGRRSRILKQLGLTERKELAPAKATISGSGTGLSGLATARVVVRRCGDEWGGDATLDQ